MVVGSTINLELIPGEIPVPPGRPRASPLDSGFHHGIESTPPKIWTGLRDPTAAATVTVERIVKQHVALVTHGMTRFIAKIFPPYTVHDPERLLNNELDVYRRCASLQGTYIPYLVGVYRAVNGSPHFSSPIMLTEYIGNGITVEGLVAMAGELNDDDEIARAEMELATLHHSALDAVARLHQLAVCHGGLDGSNMLVNKEQVVLVDFGYSAVMANVPRRVKLRRGDDDLKQLKKAFALKYC